MDQVIRVTSDAVRLHAHTLCAMQWLVKKNVASKYFVEVKFNIKNSTSSARIRIPVTVHAGVSAADIFGSGGSDAEDDNLSVHDALDDKAAVL